MSTIHVVHKHRRGEGSTIIGATHDERLARKLAAATSCSDSDVTKVTPVPVMVEVSRPTADELAVLRAVERAEAIDPEQLSAIPFLIKEGLIDLTSCGSRLVLSLTPQGRFALECAKPDEPAHFKSIDFNING